MKPRSRFKIKFDWAYLCFRIDRNIPEYQYKFIENVFDSEWYCRTYGISGSRTAAMIHFLKEGCAKGFAPCAALAESQTGKLSELGLMILATAGLDPSGKIGIDLASSRTVATDSKISRSPSPFRLAIVTACFGGIDHLKPIPESYLRDADFFILTEADAELPYGWQRLDVTIPAGLSSRLQARFVKTNFALVLAEYSHCIWMDANIILKVPPLLAFGPFIADEGDIWTFNHPDRRSVMQEVVACIGHGKESPEKLVAQYDAYADRIPDFGKRLYETNVMVFRTACPGLKRFLNIWWSEIQTQSVRDQISFPYVVAQCDDVSVRTFGDEQARNSSYFIYLNHARRV